MAGLTVAEALEEVLGDQEYVIPELGVADAVNTALFAKHIVVLLTEMVGLTFIVTDVEEDAVLQFGDVTDTE